MVDPNVRDAISMRDRELGGALERLEEVVHAARP